MRWLVLAASLLLAGCPGGPERAPEPPLLVVCHGHPTCTPHRWRRVTACALDACRPVCRSHDLEAAWAGARRTPPRLAPAPLAPAPPWSARHDAEAHLAAEVR